MNSAGSSGGGGGAPGFSGGAGRGGGVSRGGTAVATRAGGGIETGRSMGSGSFGNTVKFENSFSGKNFAMVARSGRVETKGNVPSFSISKTGAIERKGTRPNTPQTSEKRSALNGREAMQRFGPKVDATRDLSREPRQRGVSAFNDTKTLYQHKGEVKPTRSSEAKPKSQAKIEHPLYSGSREYRVSTPSHITEGSVPTHAVRDARIQYREGPESTPNTRAPEVKQKSPQKVSHPLYANTEVYRPNGINTRASGQRLGGNPQSIYERTPQTFRNADSRVVLNPQGEIKVHQSGQKLPSDTQKALRERTGYVPVRRDGSLVKGPKGTPLRQGYAGQAQEIARPTSVPEKVRAEVAVANSRRQTAVETRQTTPTKTRVEKQKAFESLLKTSTPMDLGSPQVLENAILEAQGTWNTGHEKREAGQAIKRQQAEQVKALEVQKAVKKTVTYAEVQDVLETYAQSYLKDTPQAAEAQKQKIDVRIQKHPEVKADFEQAVRVMHAYQVVMDRDAYPSTEAQVKKAVLRALDQKLTATHLKNQIAVEPELQPNTVTDQQVGLKIGVIQLEESADAVTQTQPETQMEPQLQPVTEVQARTQTQAATEAVTEQAEALSQEDMEVMTDKMTQQQTQTAPQNFQSQQMHQGIITEEEMKRLEEEELERIRLLLLAAYDRDEQKDKERYEAAVAVAEAVFTGREDEIVDGDVFVRALNQPVYDSLVSVIVPEDHPDDYLTNVIERLGKGKYSSVSEVAVAAQEAIRENPAAKPGVGTLSDYHVEQIRKSTRFPKAA